MSPRIAPAIAPFSPTIQQTLEKIMPDGAPPLSLFTTMARDERLFERFFSAGLLDKGHLSLREREIVIHRVTALCGSEYEWGVHAAAFAAHVNLTDEQLYSIVHGSSNDACWSEKEKQLLDMCDSLQSECGIDDNLWEKLREHFSENAMIELLLLAGNYRTVSYLTNGMQLTLETFGKRFPAKQAEAVD